MGECFCQCFCQNCWIIRVYLFFVLSAIVRGSDTCSSSERASYWACCVPHLSIQYLKHTKGQREKPPPDTWYGQQTEAPCRMFLPKISSELARGQTSRKACQHHGGADCLQDITTVCVVAPQNWTQPQCVTRLVIHAQQQQTVPQTEMRSLRCLSSFWFFWSDLISWTRRGHERIQSSHCSSFCLCFGTTVCYITRCVHTYAWVWVGCLCLCVCGRH